MNSLFLISNCLLLIPILINYSQSVTTTHVGWSQQWVHGNCHWHWIYRTTYNSKTFYKQCLYSHHCWRMHFDVYKCPLIAVHAWSTWTLPWHVNISRWNMQELTGVESLIIAWEKSHWFVTNYIYLSEVSVSHWVSSIKSYREFNLSLSELLCIESPFTQKWLLFNLNFTKSSYLYGGRSEHKKYVDPH